jgi:hypothetical protein
MGGASTWAWAWPSAARTAASSSSTATGRCAQLGSLPTIAGPCAEPHHLLFRNNVYYTSGAVGTPGGEGMDWVMMAKGAGYKDFAVRSLAELEGICPPS